MYSEEGLVKKARIVVAGAIAARPQRTGIVLVATGSYLGGRFDWPELDTPLLGASLAFARAASPRRSARTVAKGRVVQYAGRLLRTHAGKPRVELHDDIDVRGSPS